MYAVGKPNIGLPKLQYNNSWFEIKLYNFLIIVLI